MQHKKLHIFFLCFIFTYYLIGAAFRNSPDLFPFFSFKLFSRMPQNYEQFDILYIEGGQSHFLIKDNPTLSQLELTFLRNKIRTIGLSEKYDDIGELEAYTPKNSESFLVKLSGNPVTILNTNTYQMDTLLRINGKVP